MFQTYWCCAAFASESLRALAVVVWLGTTALHAATTVRAEIGGIAGIRKVAVGTAVRLLADALEGAALVEAATQSPTVFALHAALVNVVFTAQTLESCALAVAFVLAHKVLALATVLAGIGLTFIDVLLAQSTRITQTALAHWNLLGKES